MIVAALADAGLTPQLGLVAALGVGYAAALLTSSSTRQPGITQTLDLAPTILRLIGLQLPGSMVGSSLRTAGGDGEAADRRQTVLDIAAASDEVRPIVPWAFNLLVVLHLLLYAATVLAWQFGPSRVAAYVRRVRPLCVGLAAVPVATFVVDLLPWWRWGGAMTLAVLTAVVSVVVTAFVERGPWRHRELGPLAIVGGLTAAVLAIDVMTGTRLSIAAPLGLQPLVAGRFYGFGNVQYALFVTGCLLVAVVLAHRARRRRSAVLPVAAVGGFALVVDGTPGWGTDLGGPLAIVPGFALLALLVTGVRVTASRVAFVVAATVGTAALLALADWLRPAEQRTHLGRFVQSLIEGEAGSIVSRKVAQNVDILIGSPLSLLALGAAVCTALVLIGLPGRRRAFDESPALRAGVLGLWTMLIIGAAVNGSGTAVPATGATLAMPLLIAVIGTPAGRGPLGAGRRRMPPRSRSRVE